MHVMKIAQILKSFLISVLLALLTIQVIRCFEKYFGYPTYVSTKIVHQALAEFPAITICPEKNGYKEDVLQFHGIPSVKRYNSKTNLNWSSNDSEISETKLFDLVTYSFEELVKRVYIRYFRADCVSNDHYHEFQNKNCKISLFHWFQTDNNSTYKDLTTKSDIMEDYITEQRHRPFGKCYTIYPTKKMRKLGIYYIGIYL